MRKHCPGMIVQFSTGGRGRDQAARGAMLDLRPDMASLATGSVNFPTNIYENPPDFIERLARTMLEYDIKPEVEVFDLAMLYNAANLRQEGSHQGQASRSVRHGSPQRDADAPVRLQFPALRARRRAAGRDVGRGGHRALPVGSEPHVPGSRRTLPDGTRGQHRASTRRGWRRATRSSCARSSTRASSTTDGPRPPPKRGRYSGCGRLGDAAAQGGAGALASGLRALRFTSICGYPTRPTDGPPRPSRCRVTRDDGPQLRRPLASAPAPRARSRPSRSLPRLKWIFSSDQ